MFVLSVVEDDIRVAPAELSRPHVQAIGDAIRKIYLDKVLRNVGLCVSLFDIHSVQGGFIVPSDGGAHFTVVFRLLVFCPTPGEILLGKLIHSDPSGLQVSLGFFSDVLIPSHHLQEPSVFDEEEKLWVWKFSDEEGTVNDMIMDHGEEVRFRVASVRFPELPLTQEKGAKPFAPMEVVGDINAYGLGPVIWWAEQDAGEEDGSQQGEEA